MYVGSKSVELPGDFNVHPHLKKTHIDARLNKLKDGTAIDWATGEAMAIGSLIFQGTFWFCQGWLRFAGSMGGVRC